MLFANHTLLLTYLVSHASSIAPKIPSTSRVTLPPIVIYHEDLPLASEHHLL